jgi:hypothetical protein
LSVADPMIVPGERRLLIISSLTLNHV